MTAGNNIDSDTKFFTSGGSVFFDDDIDRGNAWVTVVFNQSKERYVKVNRFGYKILKMIDKSPGTTFEKIVENIGSDAYLLKQFLYQMFDENIIKMK